jgi:hypothetical protein
VGVLVLPEKHVVLWDKYQNYIFGGVYEEKN